MTRTRTARDGLTFDVHEAGPADGDPVVLLHGFPRYTDSWDAPVPLLTTAGFWTVAMDQRGYSPGARPRGRRVHRMTELVADAVALVERAGGRAHVVGHDRGATVAWALAATRPATVRTRTALSVPHPQAFAQRCGRYVEAPYRFETLSGLGHWIPEEAPAEVAALLLPHPKK